MEKWEIQQIVGVLSFFIVVGILIFVFTAYLVYLHEETIRVCIESGQVWTQGACLKS